MPPRPGNLNPDSKAGNARLGTGRGPNAGRSQPLPKGSVPKPTKFTPPAGIKVTRTGTTYFENPNGGRGYIQLKGGRWLGNRVPDRPLTDFQRVPELKVTNTQTGVSATYAYENPAAAVKSFMETQSAHAMLMKSFGTAIKKAK